VAVQNEFQTRNAELAENRRMEFRIGINLGDVIDEEDRIYGDGVNIAARLESMADPGGICVSKTAFDQIETKLPLGYEYLGEQSVKNIPKPVGAYRVLMKPDAVGKVIGEKRFLGRFSRKTAMAAIIVLLMIAGGLVGWNIYLQQSKKVEPASVDKMAYPLPEKPSIAVLPFDNLSGDPEQEFLGDGIAESIITALSQDPDLFIIARNSTFSYKGKPIKIQKVAEDLGVQYVLEGSVQKSGNRIRITAQLVDAISGHHLWAEQYDKNLEDLFALQDEIIIKILTALRVKLTSHGEQARQVARGTNNLKAFLKYLQAREYLLRWNKDDNLMARQVFEDVIALDPNYSSAYSALAWTYLNDIYFNTTKSPKKSIALASETVQKALALDDTLSVAIETLGYIYLLKRQHEKAIAEYERAINLNPNLPDLLARYGIALNYVGRLEESIESFEKAIRLNPIPPGWYLRNLARSYCMVGRYEDSILTYKGALDRSQNDLYAQAGLTATYSLAGRLNEARAQASEVLRVQPKFSSERYAKKFPFKDKAEIDRLNAALRKAGLPD
jgi:adenylate cyclase